MACFVMGSSPVPLKTRRVGQRCTLNLSRAETSSRWCGVVVGRGGASSVHVTFYAKIFLRRSTQTRDKLISKLFDSFGIGNRALPWLYDFRCKRTIRVKISSSMSNGFKLSQGLPQRSVLSPTLFTLFTCGIEEVISRRSIYNGFLRTLTSRADVLVKDDAAQTTMNSASVTYSELHSTYINSKQSTVPPAHHCSVHLSITAAKLPPRESYLDVKTTNVFYMKKKQSPSDFSVHWSDSLGANLAVVTLIRRRLDKTARISEMDYADGNVPCLNCGGGDRWCRHLSSLREFHRANSYCHLYGAQGQRQAYI
ncbi:hypothetical protein TNCV_2129801 [Trichonephila clavipes]|nr:hypothetical protein TNCV_2129801 [Trichonephila clavipes]